MWEYIAQMKCQAQDTTSRKIGCVRSGVWTIWSMLFVWIGMKRNFSACVNKMMSRKWVLLVFGEGGAVVGSVLRAGSETFAEQIKRRTLVLGWVECVW